MKGTDRLAEHVFFSVADIDACICAQICVILPEIRQPISNDALSQNIARHYAELIALLFLLVFAFEEAHGRCLHPGRGEEASSQEDPILIFRPNETLPTNHREDRRT